MKFEKKLILLSLLGLFIITSCSNNNSSIITNGNTEPERSNIESTGIIMPTGTGSMSDTTKLTSALEYLNHSNKLSITGNNIYRSDIIHNSSFELSKNNDLLHYDFYDDEYVMFKYENDYYKYDYSTLNKLSSNSFENINILDIIYPNLSNSLAYTNALFDANSNSYIIPVVTYNTDSRIIFKLNSNDRITTIKFSYNENDNGPSFSSLVHIEDVELSISYDSNYTFDFESLFYNTIDLIPDLLTEFNSSKIKLSNTDKSSIVLFIFLLFSRELPQTQRLYFYLSTRPIQIKNVGFRTIARPTSKGSCIAHPIRNEQHSKPTQYVFIRIYVRLIHKP